MRGFCAILVCLLSFALRLPGQTGAGRIQGTAKDATGAVIPNARVTAEDVNTGNCNGRCG
jgi:hypothetical protein